MTMAARTRKIFHDEDTRERIKAADIIDRLQQFALGNDPAAMTATQVSAAVLLLNKALPNLASVEIRPDAPATFVLRAPPESENVTDWLRDYGPRVPSAPMRQS